MEQHSSNLFELLPQEIVFRILYLTTFPFNNTEIFFDVKQDFQLYKMLIFNYTYFKKIAPEKSSSFEDKMHFKKECAYLELIEKKVCFDKILNILACTCKKMLALKSDLKSYSNNYFSISIERINFLTFLLYTKTKYFFDCFILYKDQVCYSEYPIIIASCMNKHNSLFRLYVDMQTYKLILAVRSSYYCKYSFKKICSLFYKSHIKNRPFVLESKEIEKPFYSEKFFSSAFYEEYFDKSTAATLYALMNNMIEPSKCEYNAFTLSSCFVKRKNIIIGRQYFIYNIIECPIPATISLDIFGEICKLKNKNTDHLLL